MHSLSNFEIQKIVPNAIILTYKELAKYSKLPHKDIVLLYENKPDYGHWTCIISRDNNVEFFDPYSYKPDDELAFVPEGYKEQLGEGQPTLTKLLYNDGREVEYNNHKFQAMDPNIVSCGYWTIMRLLNKHLTCDEFYYHIKKLAKDMKMTKDELVVKLIGKMLDSKILDTKQGGNILTSAYRTLDNLYRRGQKVKLSPELAAKYGVEYAPVRQLEEGEIHPLLSQYIGPGTRIDLYPNAVPINEIDDAARTHDFDYLAAEKSKDPANARYEADKKFLKEVDKYPNLEPYYTLSKRGIQLKNAANALPMADKILGNYYSKKAEPKKKGELRFL